MRIALIRNALVSAYHMLKNISITREMPRYVPRSASGFSYRFSIPDQFASDP